MTHTYTPEELASLARKVGATSIRVTGPDIAADSVDITALRTLLYHDGAEHLRQSRHYYKLMAQEAGLKVSGERAELGETADVAAAMYAALASSVTFQWTVSAILRLLERESPEIAQKVAGIVELVQDVGIEAIEDANNDLPEPVAAEVAR